MDGSSYIVTWIRNFITLTRLRRDQVGVARVGLHRYSQSSPAKSTRNGKIFPSRHYFISLSTYKSKNEGRVNQQYKFEVYEQTTSRCTYFAIHRELYL